jgi:hypothetical protein
MTSIPDRIDDHHGHAEVDGPVSSDPPSTILALPCAVCGRRLSAHLHFEIHRRPGTADRAEDDGDDGDTHAVTAEHGKTPELASDPSAIVVGRRAEMTGSRARAKNLTPEQRRQLARKAAERRWSKG